MKSSSINSKTRISELIKSNPLVIDTLVGLNPNFSKLRNSFLRNLLARRVNISDACKIAGCSINEFLDKMMSIGFTIDGQGDSSLTQAENNITGTILNGGLKVFELDVRPVLASGSDPLQLILKSGKSLKDDECLKIINTFEPVPLINLLCKQGFRSWSERPEKDIVYTWFVRDELNHAMPAIPKAVSDFSADVKEFERMIDFFGTERTRTIDVTGLEMPQPMICILENLSNLGKDEALFVYHKKLPVYLLPEIEERGFKYLIKNCPDGKVNMLISRL